MHTNGLPEKVDAALKRLLPVRHLGVAVSGGPDSVALLGVLTTLAPKYGLRLTGLHVNHALRPEAEQEQRLVEALCQRWQIPCIVAVLTPPPSRNGLEAWARAERYRFFRGAVQQYHLDAVALAHTLDDQAETVLFRLLRGSARRGLAGIPATREGWLIRPLLGCTRQEVMAYVTAQHLPYAIDASNADLRYARNKIRHLLLPFLEREFSPHLRRRLATLAETFRVEEEWLEALAAEARARVQEGPLTISLARLAAEPLALRSRVLRQWLEQTGQVQELGFQHLQRLRTLSDGSTRRIVQLPGDLQVRREAGRLFLERKSVSPIALPSYCYPLIPGQELQVPETGWRVTLTGPNSWEGPSHLARSDNPWQAVFDATALSEPILVRNSQPGDRICPLGMKGRKKVHDVFIDAKVPPAQRRLVPLIVIGTEVAWVPGCVRGDLAKVTSATRQVYRIEVNPLPGK